MQATCHVGPVFWVLHFVSAWMHNIIKILMFIEGDRPHHAQAKHPAFIIQRTYPAYLQTEAQLCKCQAH